MIEQQPQPPFPSIQLALRSVLEILGLIAYGVWGWDISAGFMAYINVAMIPGFIMMIWGVFSVPDDASRSGNALIPVRGWIRLVIEWAVFGGAAIAMYLTGKTGYAAMYAAIVAIHYLMTLSRVRWLLSK